MGGSSLHSVIDDETKPQRVSSRSHARGPLREGPLAGSLLSAACRRSQCGQKGGERAFRRRSGQVSMPRARASKRARPWLQRARSGPRTTERRRQVSPRAPPCQVGVAPGAARRRGRLRHQAERDLIPASRGKRSCHRCLRPFGSSNARRTVVPPFTGSIGPSVFGARHRCVAPGPDGSTGHGASSRLPPVHPGWSAFGFRSRSSGLPFRTRPSLAVIRWSLNFAAGESIETRGGDMRG